ncbi:hypothetical protein BH23THE1_BH23THE1_02650 [soil metagenome]
MKIEQACSPKIIGIIDTTLIAPSVFFGLLLKPVFPVIISLYGAIPLGIFCFPMVTAKAVIGPPPPPPPPAAAIETQT